MKKWLLLVLTLTLSMAMACIIVNAIKKQKPFPKSKNLAQKIVNFVVANDGNPSSSYFSNKDKPTTHGSTFRRNVYDGNVIYAIKVGIYEDGQKTLDIWRYYTNWNFDRIKSPADIAVKELVRGRLEIILKTLIYDEGVSQKAYTFQTYWRPDKHGSLKGFTSEDLKLDSEKSGIKDSTFSNGEIERNGRWVKASEEETTEIQANYNGYLKEIAKILNIE